MERHKDRQHFSDKIFGPGVQIKYTCRYIKIHVYEMYKQLTAKAPRYVFFFCSIKKKKKSLQFDWYTKNRNGQAFVWICSLLRADESLK